MAEVTRFFHPVLASSALRKKPVAVQIAGRRFALWRGPGGRPSAVLDACPHRSAPLSLGRVRPDGRLACAYHGWNFDGDGCGQSPSQPKLKCDTRAFQVVERHGYLWLADQGVSAETIPKFDWPGYTLAAAFPTHFPTPIHIALDNFTEDEHFPYIHAVFGWSEDRWADVQYEAETHDDRTVATYIGPQRASPLLPFIGVRAEDLFHNTFESRFDPVHTLYTSHWIEPKTGKKRPIEARTCVYMVPETERTTKFQTFVFIKIDQRSGFRRLKPMIEVIAHYFVKAEWQLDSRWVANLAGTAAELKGLRLGKFDKTIIRNRRLLRSVYFGEDEGGGGELVQLPAGRAAG